MVLKTLAHCNALDKVGFRVASSLGDGSITVIKTFVLVSVLMDTYLDG